jgi:hypothetical protein
MPTIFENEARQYPPQSATFIIVFHPYGRIEKIPVARSNRQCYDIKADSLTASGKRIF